MRHTPLPRIGNPFQEYAPYQRLWLAVLQEACSVLFPHRTLRMRRPSRRPSEDAQWQAAHRRRTRVSASAEAHTWLFEEATEHLGSFLFICRVLDLDPSATRQRLGAELARGAPNPFALADGTMRGHTGGRQHVTLCA